MPPFCEIIGVGKPEFADSKRTFAKSLAWGGVISQKMQKNHEKSGIFAEKIAQKKSEIFAKCRFGEACFSLAPHVYPGEFFCAGEFCRHIPGKTFAKVLTPTGSPIFFTPLFCKA